MQRSHRRLISIQINELKRNQVIKHNEKILLTIDAPKIVTQGRRGSHYNVSLKDCKTGVKSLIRFNQGSTLDLITLENSNYTYLYHDDTQIHLLDDDLKEQSVPIALIDNQKSLQLLTADSIVSIKSYNDVALSITLPKDVICKVTDTVQASSSGSDSKGTMFKQATLDTGISVHVPEFVSIGDSVLIDVETCSYKERVK